MSAVPIVRNKPKRQPASARPAREAQPQPAPAAGPLWRHSIPGFMLGVLVALAAREIGPSGYLDGAEWFLLVGGGAGALLAVSRLRRPLWAFAGFCCLLLLVVSYSPLAEHLSRGLIRRDPLERAEAVVVLQAGHFRSDELPVRVQQRLLHAYEVLEGGAAGRLVLTRSPEPRPSYAPAVRRQMGRLGLEHPVHITEPAAGQAQEAVVLGRLARERGWTRVILVSDPLSMKLSATLLEQQGLEVLCAPCVERRFDLSDRGSPSTRRAMFREWLHEAGTLEYRRRRGLL
jgi:uncharacterized SAM-binding protein YcdF (DUF218 family)